VYQNIISIVKESRKVGMHALSYNVLELIDHKKSRYAHAVGYVYALSKL